MQFPIQAHQRRHQFALSAALVTDLYFYLPLLLVQDAIRKQKKVMCCRYISLNILWVLALSLHRTTTYVQVKLSVFSVQNGKFSTKSFCLCRA